MGVQELAPGSFASLRTEVRSVGFEDVLYGLTTDLAETQLPKSAQNSGGPPFIFTCQLQDQLLNLIRCSGRPRLPFSIEGCRAGGLSDLV